ncbi:MAG: xylulokinase [Phycisphaerales bacterium]|nr:xylulokinase [Phycisphaerales bacterium]
MTARPYVLGIDIGTSGVRVLAVSQEDGQVIRTATCDITSDSPQSGWSEQHPTDWWTATCSAIQQVLAATELSGDSIAAIGLSGQMHGLVMLDENDAVLRPAILWNDQRTASECDEIHETVGRDRLIQITGKPAMTGFTAPKILWVRNHEPKIYARAARILLPKDYVRLQLTGEHVMDVTDASGTSLLNLSERTWSDQLLQDLNLNPSILPRLAESSDIVGQVTSEAAKETGLLAGTPVVAGAGDQAAGGIGCGISSHTACSLNLGTSGVIFAATPQCPHDPTGAMHGYCHAIPGHWHVMGVMLSAGGSLRWYRDVFEEGDAAGYDRIIEGAQRTAPGADGLSFLPYLTGERTPHANPAATGSFTGITNQHDRSHFARAVLEGIMFGLRDCLDLITNTGHQIDRIRMTGGGARSAFWRQMAADIFGCTITTVNVTDGSAYGAALLAMAGGGRFNSVSDAMNEFVRETAETKPSQDATLYPDIHERWRSLYPILAPSFGQQQTS